MDGFRPTNVHALHAAQLKDQDLVKWIEKKMNEFEGWSGRPFASMMSKDMIEELLTCFQGVDSPAKVKLVMALLHVNPRYLTQWRECTNTLLGFARRDPDEWVEMIADLHRDVCDGKLQSKPSPENDNFKRTANTLLQLVKAYEHLNTLNVYPRSSAYSTTTVRQIEFGSALPSKSHFVLKKPPKSEALKKEMERQMELAKSGRREKVHIVSSSIPIKMRSTRRDPTVITTPMRGIPTMSAVKMSGGFTNEPKKYPRPALKREGGAKLLDIAELPMSLKKRRRAEQEEEKKRAKEEKERAKVKAVQEKKEKEEARRKSIEKAKEDAKVEKRQTSALTSPVDTKPLTIKPQAAVTVEALTTSESDEPLRIADRRTSSVSELRSPPLVPVHQQGPTQNQIRLQSPTQSQQSVPQRPVYHHQHVPVSQQMEAHRQPMQQHFMPVSRMDVNQPAMRTVSTYESSPLSVQQQHAPEIQIRQQQQPIIVRMQPNQTLVPVSYQNQMQPDMLPPYVMQQQHCQPPQHQHQPRMLSSDLAKKIQDIIGSATALDDVGRNMIYSFMSGDLRQAPQNQQSRLVTLKLSENIEDGVIGGVMQKLKVEVYFQMDFATGEWKRMRKCRALRHDELDQIQAQEEHMIQQHWQVQHPGSGSRL